MTNKKQLGLTMSEADYSAIRALRSSELKTAARSTLAHLRHSLNRQQEDSEVFLVGRALHCAALRPMDFASEFMTAPKCDRRTKEGKAQYEEVISLAGDRGVLDEASSRTNEGMLAGIRSHPSASSALDLCQIRERVFLGKIAGLDAKCRVDALAEDGSLLIDIKTTICASPRAFTRSCVEYGYAIQFAFYRNILRQNGFTVDDCMIIAAEKTAPYLVACYRLPDSVLTKADEIVTRTAIKISHAIEQQEWAGYSDGVLELNLPPWAFTDDGEAA